MIARAARVGPAFLGLVGAIAGLGCRPKPACNPDDATGCVITKLRIRQEHDGKGGKVDEDDIKDRLATAESSLLVTNTTVELFGEKGTLFFTYERFDRLVLERDLERIERYYRSRGFYEVRVRAARVLRGGDSTVRVEIVVDEGPPTTIAGVSVDLIDPKKPLPKVPDDLGAAVESARKRLAAAPRFEETELERTKARILRAMTDRGYAYAEVRVDAKVDRARHTASVTFLVSAGPPCYFGPVVIEGLGDLPPRPLYAALGFGPGQPFSTELLDSAQTALADSGVIGSVSVEIYRAASDKPQTPIIPIRFLVQRTALRAIQVGGGAEIGARVETHLLTSWEHKNFLGDLRRFSIGARTGVLFYPWQLTDWTAEVRPLPDIRTQMELRQPAFLESRTVGSARLEANLYRPITADANVDPTTQNLYENFEGRAGAGLERPFWLSRVRLGASLNAQVIAPVPVYEEIPEGFDPLVIPYVEARASLDLRLGRGKKPDPINPRSGVFVSTTVQAAAIAPDQGYDIRVQPEVRAYWPISSDVTLGVRVAAGVLLPFNYGQPLFDSSSACAETDVRCNRERARALQILQLRGFYSGGVSSNRGYGYNGVNPRAAVPNLFDAGEGDVLVPIGGRYLWAASLELRFPITGPLGGAVFVDASDVWNDAPVGPHLSPGFGLRYATPIGPLRVDLAYRVPGLQNINGDPCDNPTDGDGCPPVVLGLPVYAAIAIGQAF